VTNLWSKTTDLVIPIIQEKISSDFLPPMRRERNRPGLSLSYDIVKGAWGVTEKLREGKDRSLEFLFPFECALSDY